MNQPVIDRGVRVTNALLTFVQEDEYILCTRDHVVIQPLEIDHGTMLALVYRGQPVRGRVLAVGRGCYHKKYDGRKGQRSKSWDSKHFTSCDIRVGDLVDLGGLELGGYLFTRIIWGQLDVVMAREADIAIVINEVTGQSRPLHDRALVRRVEEKSVSDGGVYLTDFATNKTFTGEIVALGRGRTLESGAVQPMDVKVGDRVLFEKGTQVVVDGEMLIVMREEDIVAVLEEPDWTDPEGKVHRYKCGLNPNPWAIKHRVNFCTCLK